MALNLSVRKRGRPKEMLRIFATENALKVSPAKGTKEFTIVVGKERGKVSLPDSTILVPQELYEGKNPDNIYEQLRLGVRDVGAKVMVGRITNDSTKEIVAYYLAPRETPKEKKGEKNPPKTRRGKK